MTLETMGESQARDDRFDVKDVWAEMENHPDGTLEYRREFLHRQLNEEANVMEQAAQSLVDFPDADWGIRVWLARQCSDEARHVLAYYRVMKARDIKLGDYPIINFQYRVLTQIDNLIGRLTVENRTFEADGLDAATYGVEESIREGDEELASLFDAQQADEIVHVGFANAWIKKQVEADPRHVLRMAAALSFASKAFDEVFSGGGTDVTKFSIAEAERLEAGFEPQEIAVAKDMSEARRAAVKERLTGGTG